MSEEKLTPAYVSYATFKNTVRGLAQHGHIPDRIDHSVLSSMSGSARAQFLGAMRFLGLINKEGDPSESLRKLAVASEPDWKQQLRELVKCAYTDQIKLFATGTPQQLRESFGDIGG